MEPIVRMLLARRDETADAVGEDLRSAARHRAEARVLQLAQHVLVREPAEPGHVVNLGRRIELEVNVRQRRPQLAQYVDVELEVDVRVLAVHAVDLRESELLVLANSVLDELVSGERVRALLLVRPRERTELALHPADVRLVHVDVLDEVDLVATTANPAREVGELTEGEQVVRLHQRDPVLEVEPLESRHLLADEVERRGAGEDRHYRCLSTTT
jgi:hypothetical protein